jgi:hypothetical protein
MLRRAARGVDEQDEDEQDRAMKQWVAAGALVAWYGLVWLLFNVVWDRVGWYNDDHAALSSWYGLTVFAVTAVAAWFGFAAIANRFLKRLYGETFTELMFGSDKGGDPWQR